VTSESGSLDGAERPLPPGAEIVGDVDDDEVVEVTVVLAPATERPLEEWALRPPGQRLEREDLADALAPDPAALRALVDHLEAAGLLVEVGRPGGRSVGARGPAAAVAAAFGVRLVRVAEPGRPHYRWPIGAISLPAPLETAVVAVLGLDDRPIAEPHLRRIAGGAVPVAYSPVQVGLAYNFPSVAGQQNGEGQVIGLIELGGGFSPLDIEDYFDSLELPLPTVVVVGIDGATNTPTATGADVEVALDIEVAGALAPGATLVVYFAPNTERGFVDALSAAVHDGRNRPGVISISWGAPESTWSTAGLAAMEAVFAEAAAAGLTVLAASGDQGSSDGLSDGRAHVDFPASSPYVVGCGGTRLVLDGAEIASEVVWNEGPGGGATGGGVSSRFPLPAWQQSANVPPSVNPPHERGRGVPDVAGDADPMTGYRILVARQSEVVGGTSAVAPLWAALTARMNQALGMDLGWFLPLLYSHLHPAFHEITVGSNGAYDAHAGWNACTGWGTPDGALILGLAFDVLGKHASLATP
jgi:kumamolisin